MALIATDPSLAGSVSVNKMSFPEQRAFLVQSGEEEAVFNFTNVQNHIIIIIVFTCYDLYQVYLLCKFVTWYYNFCSSKMLMFYNEIAAFLLQSKVTVNDSNRADVKRGLSVCF